MVTTKAAIANKTAVKKAEPKPGDAAYDWTAHYDTDHLYVHTFKDGKVVALRTFDAIYSKTWLYKVQRMVEEGATDVDVEFAALNRAACPVAQELLLDLDDSVGDPIDELWQAWVTSGTKPDENATDDTALSVGKSIG